jgi:hypothetical protein
MDKKTKLLLGVGVVAVGAYLLFKSKKSSTASLVGFAGVKDRMKPMTGGMINSLDVKGGRYGAGQGVFANADSNEAMKSSFYSVKGGKYGAGQGVFADFANQPFNFSGADAVGERTMPFAAEIGERKIAADGKFFQPRTARYGTNQGVFAPKKTTMPVFPTTEEVVNDKSRVNNLVGFSSFVG